MFVFAFVWWHGIAIGDLLKASAGAVVCRIEGLVGISEHVVVRDGE